MNAVAPDWNLKWGIVIAAIAAAANAVAPDWNLKMRMQPACCRMIPMQSHQIGI